MASLPSPTSNGSSAAPPPTSSGVSLDEVTRALEVLFHGNDPQLQMQANAWLLAVMSTHDAWTLSLSLLSSTAASASSHSFEVLSFSAQTLYSKCRNEWNALSLPDRQSLQLQLLRHLRVLSSSPTLRPSLLQRLADSIAILAIRSGKGGCHHLMQSLLTSDGGLHPTQPPREEERYIALLVLTALAEEVKRVKVSYTRSQELWDEVQEAVPAVFQLVLDTFTTPAFSPSTPTRLPVLYQALEALTSYEWMNFVSSERALELLSSSGLMSQLLRLLHALLYAPPSQQRMMEMAVDVLAYALEAELERLDDEQIEAMQRAMQPVYEALVSLIPLFNHCHAMCGAAYIPTLAPSTAAAASSLPPPASVSVASFLSHRFALLLDVILRADIAAVSQGLGHSLPLIHTHLAFASYPYPHRATTLITLTFWEMLQARPVKERHKELRQPLFSHLVDVLLQVTRYPPSFTRWEERGVGFAGEKEEWESFCQEIGVVLGDALWLLKEEFCAVCARRLQAGEGDWTVVTSVVQGLTAISDTFEVMSWEGKPTASITAALIPLFQRLLHVQSLPSHLTLTAATCTLLYNLHFWLCEQPTLLHPALSYLIGAAGSAPQAGKAFSRLMGKASKLLAEETGTVEGVLTAVLRAWGGWSEDSRLEFCAGLGMLLEHVRPTERAAGYLHQLVSPVVASINAALQQREEGTAGAGLPSKQVMFGLRLLSRLLWSEGRPADAVGEALSAQAAAWQAVRLQMMEGLWETLDRVEQARWEEEEEVKGQLCRLYDDLLKMLKSGSYLTQALPPLLQRTVRCFTSCPTPVALAVLESALPTVRVNPSIFPAFFAVLPTLTQTALRRIEADPAGQAGLVGVLLRFLSLFTAQTASLLRAEHYSLFLPILSLTTRVLPRVHDGYCHATAAQLYVELLFSINHHSEQRTRVEARPLGDETDEQRAKREAWLALWAGQMEACVHTMLGLLLAQGYGDEQGAGGTPPSATSAAASDDDDEGGGVAQADRSRQHGQMFRPKATQFVFHSALVFGDGVKRGVEGEVRRACERGGWRGEDVERVVVQVRQWMVDGEARRWSELFEDVRRLVHGEEMVDVMLTYEMAWEDRKRREEDKSRRAAAVGGSKHLAIQLTG